MSHTEFLKDEVLTWADGFMLVYSIIDKSSFAYLREAKKHILSNRPPSPGGHQGQAPCPMVVVANKADLIHLRQVSSEDGRTLAKEQDAAFLEVAASEHVSQVADAFYELCREVHTYRRRSKQSLLDRLKYGGRNSRGDGKKKAEN
ncbi:UNVERIFIED_CONTAM: Ras-like protein family member 11A [Trichonephila clavipes]